MSQLTRNITSNLVGKGWSSFMVLAFVPLYIKLMGIEAYGLVGFFTVLQGLFAVLDLGLSTTLNRELARRTALSANAQETRDLVRTLEMIYWAVAALIGILVLVLSPFIARDWVKAETLTVHAVTQAVMLMGLVMAFQWPLGFYSGGLLGLQKQTLYNVLNGVSHTLRSAGVVVILWLVSSSVVTFFAWQAIISAFSAAVTAIALWRSLPPGSSAPRFRACLVRPIWRFSAGLSVVAVTVLLLGSSDKIILSKLMPLEAFGYYSLAGTVANGLAYLIGPIFTAFFPSFSQRVAVGDTKGLTELYHRACQLMSVTVLPVATVVVVFAPEVLLIWTRNPGVVENAHLLVSLLVAGTALSGLHNIPYALQLAYGWTRLTIYANLIAILAIVPLLIFLISLYGSIGAATVWVALNMAYVLVGVQIMHRRLLPGEQLRWYLEDVGRPLGAVLAVIMLGRWMIQGEVQLPVLLAYVVGLAAVAWVVAALAADRIRSWAWSQVGNMRTAYRV